MNKYLIEDFCRAQLEFGNLMNQVEKLISEVEQLPQFRIHLTPMPQENKNRTHEKCGSSIPYPFR
jgi:hypothetical protein